MSRYSKAVFSFLEGLLVAIFNANSRAGKKPEKSINSAAVCIVWFHPFKRYPPPFPGGQLHGTSFLRQPAIRSGVLRVDSRICASNDQCHHWRPGHWKTPRGVFDFRHVRIDFFKGYQLVNLNKNQQAFIATPEKALLDLVYLEPGGDSKDYLMELRLENLNRLDWQALERLAKQLANPKPKRAVREIRKLAGEEEEFESL